jgi:hypothetical protein
MCYLTSELRSVSRCCHLTATVTTEPEVPAPLMPKKASFSEKFPGQNAVDRIFCVCVCVCVCVILLKALSTLQRA